MMRFHVCVIFAAFFGAVPNVVTSTNSSASYLRGNGDFPGRLASAERALNALTDQRWKDRVGDVVQIPYEVDPIFTAAQKQLIESSIQALADGSNVIQFVQRSNQAAYINVVDKIHSCHSNVGRLGTGKVQEINLSREGCLRLGTIQHEFLHALGFTHEQNRPDRDDYVTINLDNIIEKYRHNFDKRFGSKDLGAPYEYGSVLHYSRNAFAIDGTNDTVIAKDPTAVLGQREGATVQDLLDIRLLYQCLSGPRDWSAYQDNLCTFDCKCWEGATGCNGNDDWCQGGLACQDNKCVRGSGGGGDAGGGCTDVVGWEDIDGDGCDWYEENNVVDDACNKYGDDYANDVTGTTAKEACCVCGGGSLAGATFWTLRNLDTPVMCLDLSFSSTRNGNKIVHYECNDGPAQKWWIDSNSYIRSALDTNKCIVGAKGATENGTQLMINDCFANDDRFVFWYFADGTLRPENDYSLCIGPSRSDVHTSLAAPFIELGDCSDSLHQVWVGFKATHTSRQLSKEGDVPGRALQQCSDVPLGWYDAYGDNCAWYAEGSRCDDYGNANKNFGKTANQACCSCGAGSLVAFVPEADMPLSDPVLSNKRCWDTPDWTDSVGDRCTWYEQGDNCLYYGDEFATAGGNANKACCACGGGSLTPPPDGDVFDAPGCSNSPGGWMDSDGDDCYWYAQGDNCGLYGNDYAGEESKTASEACCACGGGSNPSNNLPLSNDFEECSDIIQWADSFGDGCQSYSVGDNCGTYGGANAGVDGRTAAEACCVCGGGILAACNDLPSNWADSTGDGCAWYENGDNCYVYGDEPGNAGPDGHTASEACCICGGGSATRGLVAASKQRPHVGSKVKTKQDKRLASMIPSSIPSNPPSETPSDDSSGEPSRVPSLTPSALPSLESSDVPSQYPSNLPSEIPSQKPSGEPSRVPSLTPSALPSLESSDVPSQDPSKEPSR